MIRIFIKSDTPVAGQVRRLLEKADEVEIVEEESLADVILIYKDVRTTDRPDGVMLSPRELDVLRLIADGEGNKSIAGLLGISTHTVKFHISSIFQKLGVSSRTEAVKAGIHNGLISI